MQKRCKLEKIGWILGLLLSLGGLFKLDGFLYQTLDYFGKYVFFILMNIFAVWLPYAFYRVFNGYLKILMPILAGGIILLIGVKFA
jgi:hypothetical protein